MKQFCETGIKNIARIQNDLVKKLSFIIFVTEHNYASITLSRNELSEVRRKSIICGFSIIYELSLVRWSNRHFQVLSKMHCKSVSLHKSSKM